MHSSNANVISKNENEDEENEEKKYSKIPHQIELIFIFLKKKNKLFLLTVDKSS